MSQEVEIVPFKSLPLGSWILFLVTSTYSRKPTHASFYQQIYSQPIDLQNHAIYVFVVVFYKYIMHCLYLSQLFKVDRFLWGAIKLPVHTCI